MYHRFWLTIVACSISKRERGTGELSKQNLKLLWAIALTEHLTACSCYFNLLPTPITWRSILQMLKYNCIGRKCGVTEYIVMNLLNNDKWWECILQYKDSIIQQMFILIHVNYAIPSLIQYLLFLKVLSHV